MALYEFRCDRCAAVAEIRCPLGEAKPPDACPACGSEHLSRLFRAVAFHPSTASRMQGVDLSAPADASFLRDSRNVGLRTQAQLDRMGVDLGDGFREVVEKARSGELLNEKASETP